MQEPSVRKIDFLKVSALQEKFLFIFYKVPESLFWDDWLEWDLFIKQHFPVQFFFRETLYTELCFYKYKINTFFYYWKCKIFTPFNIIKLPTTPTWTDTDHRLELAIETLLIEFIEKESPKEFINWNSDIQHKEAWAAICEAYDFIKNKKPRLELELDELNKKCNSYLFPKTETDKENVKKDIELSIKLEKEKTKIYINIVKYRSFLWT